MDVTSLLNPGAAASLAAEQSKQNDQEHIERTPASRKPWDAGGYSLPLDTSLTAPLSLPDTPKEISRQGMHNAGTSVPQHHPHGFSDSRSSVSSFASSIHSNTHSRYSSISTVNSSINDHQGRQYIDEISPTSGERVEAVGVSEIHGGNWPISQLSRARALATEDPSLKSLTLQDLDGKKKITEYNKVLARTLELASRRSSSPSDAILIKRSAQPTLTLDTGASTLKFGKGHTSDRFLPAPTVDTPTQSSIAKLHKRSLSAPGSAQGLITQRNEPSSSSNSNHGNTLGESELRTVQQPDFDQHYRMLMEPTTLTSYRSDIPSSAVSVVYPEADIPPRGSTEPEARIAKCMYIPNCDTDSQLRKAISHIFGRNKMCTRLIPQLVWVHYCRKHYQRSRYRNPKEYAKLQCNLVQEQIRRIHDWSEVNAASGASGVVQDWGLSVRKREAKRLEDSKNRKRRASAFDNDGSDDEGAGPVTSVPPTAVPQWLLDSCGKGYNTQQILDIFNSLHSAVLQDLIAQFPDIEILPNILADQEISKAPKVHTKIDPSDSSHRRSQSLGLPLSSSYALSNKMRTPLPSTLWGIEDLSYRSPIHKRRRANDRSADVYTDRFMQELAQAPPMETGRRMQLPHRPVFANIEEHRTVEHGENSFQQSNLKNYSRAPLPAPIPQRTHYLSMAAHLETSNDRSSGRPVHTRSQSDVGIFSRHRNRHPSPPQSYRTVCAPQYRSPMQQPQLKFTHNTLQQCFQECSTPQMRQLPSSSPNKHLQHQRTPVSPGNPMPPFSYDQSMPIK
ncbi:hypothetical protein BJ878DRAFT_560828 [Calycina marina]|uniref:Orp1 like protein n=1 Tax=Calycina marina TaxID=1763456 RepID=A0A9P7YVC2_9HELO|nr:hypothetical protein BJ878DRAFT_560828 [Calycina marina]